MTNSAVRISLFVGFGLSAFGQLDAYKLRDKYGAPLDRETFTVRPGIEMVVDYGPGKQVCRIQFPSGTQDGGAASDRAVTRQRLEEILDEVVPPSIRGKELALSMEAFGVPTMSFSEYQRVSIVEANNGDVANGITVTFKDAACPKYKDVNDRPPRLLHSTEPEYSDEARIAKFQGTVELRIDVDALGNVAAIYIIKAIGLGLDKNCVEAVRKWQFESGRPIQGMKVECNFRLP
jgi:TonB family protein